MQKSPRLRHHHQQVKLLLTQKTLLLMLERIMQWINKMRTESGGGSKKAPLQLIKMIKAEYSIKYMGKTPVGGRFYSSLLNVINSPTMTNNNNNNFDDHSILPAKRNLDDYDQPTSSQFNDQDYSFVRRRKNSLPLQFFVKTISGGNSLVIQSNLDDTIELVLKKIEMITGIPFYEQRLIYRGKQLELEMTLESCCVQNDSCLQLVGRLRSTVNSKAWRVINDIVHYIYGVCRYGLTQFDPKCVKVKLEEFMALPFDNGSDPCTRNKIDYCMIFMEAGVPQALVMMYKSSIEANKKSAIKCVKWFVGLVKGLGESESGSMFCAMTILEVCMLIKKSVSGDYDDDLLYVYCRSVLGTMLKEVELTSRRVCDMGKVRSIGFDDVFLLFMELGQKMLKDWVKYHVQLEAFVGPLGQDVCDFSAFLQPVLSFMGRVIGVEKDSGRGKGKGNRNGKGKGKGKENGSDEFNRLYYLFADLLSWIDQCMHEMEDWLGNKSEKGVEVYKDGWSHYLTILKELSRFLVLLPDTEDWFWNTMRKNKVVVRALVVRYAKCSDDYLWLLKHKDDILDFESRRHLAMLLFPKVDEDYEDFEEMLIDRSQLLAESFEYISSAEPSYLQAGLFMEFKNEEATGPGVLREWFCLVCQALFDPRNALFVACPLDRRRFYPNPASKVHPLHIRYFRFAGRVIALALMHRVQIGSILDRVFFLQLAGRCVSVEDVKDADPCIYNSCKQILEMDPEFVDSDGLGLTFVTEVEELGSRKVVELCSGGKEIVVNSKNRKEFVDLVVQQRFVTSITEQVSSFARGFADILADSNHQSTFFGSLELEDLDWMLHGSGSQEISVEDWKKHTDCHGYKKSDPQIVWFWEVVGQLNAKQKKILLCFWTSVKYLPVDGFRGLASKLFIHKSLEPQDRLPSSHTCFYQLCIPPYPTKAIMQDRLRVITQDHVGCSFGTC